MHEVPLHDIKVKIWCAVCATRVIGFAFVSDKIKQERSMKYILRLILETLGKENMSFLSKTVRLPIQPLIHWPPDVIA